jgi:hypothetical protein
VLTRRVPLSDWCPPLVHVVPRMLSATNTANYVDMILFTSRLQATWCATRGGASSSSSRRSCVRLLSRVASHAPRSSQLLTLIALFALLPSDFALVACHLHAVQMAYAIGFFSIGLQHFQRFGEKAVSANIRGLIRVLGCAIASSF